MAEKDTTFAVEEESNRLPAEMGKNVTYSLFAYPAEDNFAGVKYPLDWIEKIHNGHFHDVIPLRSLNRRATSGSSFSTRLPSFPPARLDLSAHKPDFVCISFYKLFGYPTGTGALLIRNKHVNDLRKLYWGGGTVQMASELDRYNLFHVFRGCFVMRRTVRARASRTARSTFSALPVFATVRLTGGAGHRQHQPSCEQPHAIPVQPAGSHPPHKRQPCGGGVRQARDGRFGRAGRDRESESAARRRVVHRVLRGADGVAEAPPPHPHGVPLQPGACRKYLRQPADLYERVGREKRACADTNDLFRGIPLGASGCERGV